MNRPERPTEGQIHDWLSQAQASLPRRALGQSRSLPRLARVLWLRYCVEPFPSTPSIANECSISTTRVWELMRQGVSLLAQGEEQGVLADGWDPESTLGQAVSVWRVRHRVFITWRQDWHGGGGRRNRVRYRPTSGTVPLPTPTYSVTWPVG